jgi:DNA-binding CsgD family transcriptional regulator
MRRGRPSHNDILTPREWEVLALIEEGLTNEQIAARLGINVGTSKYHVGEILSKLEVNSRSEAPAAARQQSTLQSRPAGALAVLLRLKSSWLAAAALSSVLILALIGFLVLIVVRDDEPPLSLESPEGTVEGIGLDAGPSPTPGAASQLAPPNCVSGPPAENPTQQSPSGATLTMPASEQFGTVEDAEAWICLDVPQAPVLPGWRIAGVAAHRSHSLSQFTQGRGRRTLDISYVNEADSLRVDLTTPGAGTIEGAGEESSIMVGGVEAKLWRKGLAITLQWEVDGVPLIARITPADDTKLGEAVALLESVR